MGTVARVSCFIVLLLLSFWVSTAEAAFEALTCKEQDPRIIKVLLAEPGVSCQPVAEFQRVAIELRKLFGNADPVTLFLRKSSYEASADESSLMVLAVEQLAWGAAKSFEQRRMIWAHEYGHILHFERLARDFAPLGKFKDYLLESHVWALIAKDPSTDASGRMTKKWNQELQAARDLKKPYAELFADLVAALWADDPEAMKRAMDSPSLPEKQKRQLPYYAFSGQYDLSKWAVEDVHHFFAPTKAYLGARFVNRPLSPEEKRFLLDRVYIATLREIQHYWEHGRKIGSPSEASAALIAQLGKPN